ncbi:hypothetical protein WJX72_011280 [[Myrmecia] bisecta]|uniref:50S ribosomal protein L27, chloroplastic n=1 Tax=[Myrmecia] bisecta TaxID=41462 RepID=A0AAW1QGE3_9CHLO
MLTTSFAGLSLGSSTFQCGRKLQQRATLRVAAPVPQTIEAAHKKGAGSTKNGRDSNAQRRGVKVYGGQPVKAGGIIIRQLGTKVHPGVGVGCGKDFTLYALQSGIVVFKKSKYDDKVSVIPFEDYEKPEGQKRKPDGRRAKKRKLYPSRVVLAANDANAAFAAASS